MSIQKQHSTEAILCAYLATGDLQRNSKNVFRFYYQKTENSIKVISNKGWLHNNKAVHKEVIGGEPIDVAYTILALLNFTFKNNAYQLVSWKQSSPTNYLQSLYWWML
jgi:hypothetical protein